METRDNDKKKGNAQRTPIIDGDARPDMNLHPEDKKRERSDIASIKDEKKTTKNRVDTNSLEDFRDAKQE